MRPPLPTGASEIWDMRVRGKKPNEIVFISLVGALNEGNFQVLVREGSPVERMDWRWVVDLCVCIVHSDFSDPAFVAKLANLLVKKAPNGGYLPPFNPNFGYVWLWNVSKQDGSMVSWWGGHPGIPLLEIPDVPEQIEVCGMFNMDRHYFKGVAAL